MVAGGAPDSGFISAEAVAQETSHAADCRYADARQIVNLPIGQTFLEQAHDLPAIDDGLQLGRSAEILEEISALFGGSKRNDRVEERVFGTGLAAIRVVTVRFHRGNVIVY